MQCAQKPLTLCAVVKKDFALFYNLSFLLLMKHECLKEGMARANTSY